MTYLVHIYLSRASLGQHVKVQENVPQISTSISAPVPKIISSVKGPKIFNQKSLYRVQWGPTSQWVSFGKIQKSFKQFSSQPRNSPLDKSTKQFSYGQSYSNSKNSEFYLIFQMKMQSVRFYDRFRDLFIS